jgi:hypothetical protein
LRLNGSLGQAIKYQQLSDMLDNVRSTNSSLLGLDAIRQKKAQPTERGWPIGRGLKLTDALRCFNR